MKKIVKLTESDLVRIIKKIVKEQPDSKFDTPYNKGFLSNSAKNSATNKPTNFRAKATVNGDSYGEFPVVKFTVSGSNVKMFFIFKDYYDKEKLLYVNNFQGPIYDANTNKIEFAEADFNNINNQNYKQISKSQNIPIVN